MKTLALLLVSALFCLLSAGTIWVNGYYRADGTYVEGHYRTTPDNSTYNNYGGEYNSPRKSTYNTYDNNSSSTYSSDQVWVEGYTRKDGTYVPGHYRSR